MILYRQAKRLVVEKDGQFYPLQQHSLDQLFARPDLYGYLEMVIGTNGAVPAPDPQRLGHVQVLPHVICPMCAAPCLGESPDGGERAEHARHRIRRGRPAGPDGWRGRQCARALHGRAGGTT